MASDRSVRQIVAAEMNATTPRMISSRASSAQLQRDSGTPVVAGSSQANALISAFTEGGKDPGPSAPRASSRPFKRCSKNRFRQRCTTCGLVSSRAAISTFANPSAASSTILARTTRQYGSV